MSVTAQKTAQLVPLPTGWRIELDPDARELRRGVWFGGQPARVLRLSDTGADALDHLRDAPVATATHGLLARRLTDAGIAHPVPAPTAVRSDVTVVVPAYNRPAELDRCLAALGRRYPVLVVDDASTDAAEVRAVAHRHGAHLVRHAVNSGPGVARNTGLAQTHSELVAFVDSDTVPCGDWLERLAAHLDDSLVAAVAPRVVALTATSAAGRYTRARGSLDLGPRPALVLPYTRVSYVPSAVLLVRRSALGSADHVFDPGLRVGEDVDLVWRLVAAGQRVRFAPAITVAHDEPSSWRTLLRRRFTYGTSAAALAHRHPDDIAPLLVHPWFIATVLAGLAGRPRTTVLAATVALTRTATALRRADVPAGAALPMTATGVAQTLLGTSRYAVQFAAPLLLAALARGGVRTRATAAVLLGTPAVAAWRGRRGPIDPLTFVAGAIADDIAYGAGVIAGCIEHRTTTPLRPTRARRRAS